MRRYKAVMGWTGYRTIAHGLMKSMPYLIILITAWALKSHYSRAGSDELKWILLPVARMVEWVSASTFVYESATGYIDRSRQIIIAPGCAGVNFMIVTLCMTGFRVLPLSRTHSDRLAWFGFSIASAYLLTIIANTLRIVIATGLYQVDIYGPWVTPARVHRLSGIVVYLFLLCGFFTIVSQLKQWRFRMPKIGGSGLIPLMWYMAVTIGVPLLNGADSIGTKRFFEHSAMVFTGGIIVFFCIDLLQRAYKKFVKNDPVEDRIACGENKSG